MSPAWSGRSLGGFAVDSLSWRYIFYINLPLGIAALIVTNRVLKLPKRTRQVLIDWWGALLLVAGVSSILLGDPVRRHRLPVGLVADRRPVRARCARPRRLRRCARLSRPSRSCRSELFKMQIFTVCQHRLVRQRRRDVRRARVPAAVPPARPWRLGDRVGPAAAAAADGSAGDEHRLRPLHLRDRSLPLVPARRHHPGHHRPDPADPARRPHVAHGDQPRHPRLRRRARPVHAGADPGRAERRADEPDGRRDLVGHVLPLDGRGDRGVGARRRADRADRRRVRQVPAAGRAGPGRQGVAAGVQPRRAPSPEENPPRYCTRASSRRTPTPSTGCSWSRRSSRRSASSPRCSSSRSSSEAATAPPPKPRPGPSADAATLPAAGVH